MEQLKQLFLSWAGEPCSQCSELGAGGSSRRYFRIVSPGHRCIGAIAPDRRENEAFFAFSRHLRAKQMPVPELYAVAPDRCRYLQQDLGDQTLYSLLHQKKQQGGGFDHQMLALYRQALADLAAIQQAGAGADFSVAYPRPAFDRRAILWDLGYFKYYFLKLADIPFDEELLENDFQTLADRLLAADTNYFMYRDFNPRNIMVLEKDELYYIDYQGARLGAAQYDVASLLYSAKSDLPDAIRTDLLNHYLDVRHITGDSRRQWTHHFWNYLLVRILQTLGAYGFRGLYQRKDYFIQSIPLALRNLHNLCESHPVLDGLPQLQNVEHRMRNEELPDAEANSSFTIPHSSFDPPLTVTVQSFSFKQGLPSDPSGNGGGHIFDCRALPNPGRYPEYKPYTGRDPQVIQFLRQQPAVDQFLENAKRIVAQSVDKYIERRFTSLMVSFGCTGGQHRSVYCAEQMAAWLRSQYPHCNIVLRHREQDR